MALHKDTDKCCMHAQNILEVDATHVCIIYGILQDMHCFGDLKKYYSFIAINYMLCECYDRLNIDKTTKSGSKYLYIIFHYHILFKN